MGSQSKLDSHHNESPSVMPKLARSLLLAFAFCMHPVVADEKVANEKAADDKSGQKGPAESAPADTAKKEPVAGHSMHGETFNEGPRQAAYLMEGMGNIEFDVSTSHGEAKKFFRQESPSCMASGTTKPNARFAKLPRSIRIAQ